MAEVPRELVIGQKSPDVKYVERYAVRAIVYNPSDDKISIIHIAKGNYYKLPGGGVDPGEDYEIAVHREILEETGCKVDVVNVDAMGKSEEWRNDLHQISVFFIARLKEDTGKPEITELEKSEGLTHVWLTVPDAIRAMREIEPTSELGKYIKERDLFFVQKFESWVNE